MEVRFYLPLKPRAPIRAPTLSTPPPSRLNSPSLSPHLCPPSIRYSPHPPPPPLCLSILSLSLPSPSLLRSPSLFNPLTFCSAFSLPQSISLSLPFLRFLRSFRVSYSTVSNESSWHPCHDRSIKVALIRIFRSEFVYIFRLNKSFRGRNSSN